MLPQLKMILVAYGAWEAFWWGESRWRRKHLWGKARQIADREGGKMLVVGAPMGMYPCGDSVVDLADPSEVGCPNYVRANLTQLPFADDAFKSVFVSHVLEHVCDPQAALAELRRVAEHVFIAYPYWWRTVTWASPGHVWVMSPKPDGDWRFLRIRQLCDRPGFLGGSEPVILDEEWELLDDGSEPDGTAEAVQLPLPVVA